jgi:hypothetical protein
MKKSMNKQSPTQSYRKCLDAEMLNREDQKKAYELCLEFLQGVEKSRRMNYEHTSYGYKHMVEGKPHRGYVYEGTFILAALEAGFNMRQLRPGCLKAVFNIKEGSLMKRIREWSPSARITDGSVGGGTLSKLLRAVGALN